MTNTRKPKKSALTHAVVRDPLNIPGVYRASDVAATQTQAAGCLRSEHGLGQERIKWRVQGMLHSLGTDQGALASFLQAVLFEPEVAALLREKPTEGRPDLLASLRQAAALSSKHPTLIAQYRPVIYVATIVRGIQEMLTPQFEARGSSGSDGLRAVVRRALHRFEDRAPQSAWLFRLCLEWGNDDEADDWVVAQCREVLAHGLQVVGILDGQSHLH